MLKFFPQWIKRLSKSGIDGNLSAADASRITMCNIFNLFAISGFILFIFIIGFFKWWLIVSIEFVFVLLFATSILFNHFKKYNYSRVLFLSAFCGFILFFSWLDYRHTVGVYYYLFVLPLMIFVLFDSRQLVHILVSLTIVVITYVLITEIQAPFYLRSSAVSDNDETIMHILNVAIIYFIISFIAFHFAKIYHEMNESLSMKQKQLADNHSLAKAGNWYYSLRMKKYKYGSELKDIFRISDSDQKTETDYFQEYLSPADKNRFASNWSNALNNKVSVEDDYELNLKDGTKKFIVAVMQPVTQLNNMVRGLQGVCIDVTEERKTQLYLEEHLREKEVLLDEIHHRINYNLSLITGFIQLQMVRADDDHVREMLDVCRQRIATMTLIHEKMYASNFNSTLFDDYLHDLIQNIRKSISGENLEIEVVEHLEPTVLQYNNVLPCGLIINELMTNSFKHAFVGRSKGVITITLKRIDKNIVITYTDDGVGYNESDENSGIGMDLMQSLAEQLKGTITMKNQNGFYCTLTFSAINA